MADIRGRIQDQPDGANHLFWPDAPVIKQQFKDDLNVDIDIRRRISEPPLASYRRASSN